MKMQHSWACLRTPLPLPIPGAPLPRHRGGLLRRVAVVVYRSNESCRSNEYVAISRYFLGPRCLLTIRGWWILVKLECRLRPARLASLKGLTSRKMPLSFYFEFYAKTDHPIQPLISSRRSLNCAPNRSVWGDHQSGC